MTDVFGGSGATGTFLLLAAAILIYVVAKSAGDVLLAGREVTAGRLAVAHALPVALVAWGAAVAGEPELALGAVLGSTVAGLSLVVGVALTGGPFDARPTSARAWQFVLPLALVLLMTGFGAKLTLKDAVMLALIGAAVAGVWKVEEEVEPTSNGPHDAQPSDAAVPSATDERAGLEQAAGPSLDRLLSARVVLTLLLGGFAGWMVVRGATDVAASRRGLSPGVMGVTLVSSVLVLPAIGAAMLLSRTGRVGVAIGAQVGTAVLALTVVLPVSIVLWHLRTSVLLPTEPIALRSAEWWRQVSVDASRATSLPFPVGFWRIETALLIALALPLMPVALGRWKPGRSEGIVLIVLYVAYLMAVTAAGERWH